MQTLLAALAGFDAESPESVAPPEGWSPAPSERSDLSGLRLGRLGNLTVVEQEPSVREGFAAALGSAQELGAKLVDLALTDYDPGAVRRAALLVVEAEAAFAHGQNLQATPENFSDDFHAALRFGGEAPAWRLVKAERTVAEAGAALRRLFADVDFLVTPTAPQAAFSFAAQPPDNQAEFTAMANFAGCPALSLPCGLSEDGLPLGFHLVAAPWDEANLLAVAARLEVAFGFAGLL